MIKKTIQTQEVPVYEKFCDDCGKQLTIGMQCSAAKCEICGKDLCEPCIGHEVNTYQDYREVYCKSCWNIGEPYRKQIHELENKIEDLENEWKSLAIKASK